MEQKRLTRRDFLRAATGVGATALLAACAPIVVQAPAEDEGGGAAPSAEVTVVNLAQVWEAAFRPHQEEYDNNFMDRHPEIVLKRTYNSWADHNEVVPAWAAAGTLPDIIYVHGSRSYPWASEGIIVSIQDFVDEDKEFNVEGIWEESLRLYRFEGNQVAIPYDHGPKILGYNKDLFDAAGVDYPDDSWTMDTFRETAIALTDLDNNIFGWSGELPSHQHEAMLAWGGRVMNEEQTEMVLDSDENREAFQFWVDLIHTDKAAPTPAESEAFEQGVWISGGAAMAKVASWNTPTLDKFAAFSWDVANWPTGPAGRGTGSFGSGFAITKDSANPDAAWTYLREYLSTEGMTFVWGSTGRGSPARKDAYESWMNSDIAPDNAQAFLAALDEYAVTDVPYATAAAAELSDIWNREFALIRSADKSIDEGMATIIADSNDALAKA